MKLGKNEFKLVTFFFLSPGLFCLERCRLQKICVEGSRGQASSQAIQPNPVFFADETGDQASSGPQPQEVSSGTYQRHAQP